MQILIGGIEMDELLNRFNNESKDKELNLDITIELSNEDDNEFDDEFDDEFEYLTSFTYKDYLCVFLNINGKYILAYEKSDGTQYTNEFNSFQDLLIAIIENNLQLEGEDIG